MQISGKTILITGGSAGIGLELARRLLDLGNTVIVTGRDQAKLDGAKKQFPKLHTIASDVSDPGAIRALGERVVGEFPELSLLINNAGVGRTINLNEPRDLTDLTREIEINLMGPMRMVAQFLPHLKTKKEAGIMNVSSGLAFVPLPITPVYCATKAGLHSYTMSLREQLKKTTVRVFELAPPATQTELLNDFGSDDMKGITIMKVEDMVEVALKGLRNDQYEIRPGQSNQLKFMSRFAPGFIFKQMSKPVDRMLANRN